MGMEQEPSVGDLGPELSLSFPEFWAAVGNLGTPFDMLGSVCLVRPPLLHILELKGLL